MIEELQSVLTKCDGFLLHMLGLKVIYNIIEITHMQFTEFTASQNSGFMQFSMYFGNTINMKGRVIGNQQNEAS